MSSGRKDKLDSATYRRLRRRVAASSTYCYLCDGRRGPLDPRIKWPHPLSTEVDHVHPRGAGGQVMDPANLRPVHRQCNLEKGMGQAPETPPATTRQW